MQIVERKNRNFVIDGINNQEVFSRNFKGEEKRNKFTGQVVNSQGRRNFLLGIDDTIAEELAAHGCEVKYTKPRDDGDAPKPYVSIVVSYYIKPVEVYVVSNGVMTALNEAAVGDIDDMDISNMCIELQYGKEKIHRDGTPYTPLFAQKIWVEMTPSYMAEKYAQYRKNDSYSDENDPF